MAVAITGKTPSGEPINGAYKFTDEFPMADRFEENEDKTPEQRHQSMSRAQRLKRVFNIDVSVCRRGAAKAIASIEDQSIFD